jgi:hypothetical protein
MPRRRGPAHYISTGLDRLGGVVDFSSIELSSEETSSLLEILDLPHSSSQAIHSIREFSLICGMAKASREVYLKTRPKRSYARIKQPKKMGNPAKHYRAILASDIANLMLGLQLTPKIIRLDPWEETPAATYHRLFKLALEVSGDRSISDPMRARYLTRGLEIERNPPLNEISRPIMG